MLLEELSRVFFISSVLSLKMKSNLLFLIAFVSIVNGAVISSVNFAFEVFSPKSMVRFFEFNDNDWNISQDCVRNMYSYLEALQLDTLWAYKREWETESED